MPLSSPAVDAPSPFSSWKFEHAALRVPDLDAAVAWFTEKLDFRLIKSVHLGEKMYGFIVSSSGDVSFMVELVAGAGAEQRPTYEDLGSSLKLSGLHHLGFRVDRVDDTVTELKRRGVTIISEPHDVPKLGLRVSFFADPWGNLFEVIEPIGVREAPNFDCWPSPKVAKAKTRLLRNSPNYSKRIRVCKGRKNIPPLQTQQGLYRIAMSSPADMPIDC